MLPTALCLMVLALALAWPAPIVLAASSWTARSPGLALALWQSIALAGGMSMIGSLLIFGLIPFGPAPVPALIDLIGHVTAGTLPAGATLPGVMALCLAIILGAHLLLNLSATFIRAERQRRRHHNLIGLLSDPLPDHRDGTRVIDHAAPIAYCLPGATRSATVLSMGLLRLLDADQLRGVIAHERAHLRQQHHLVLLAFKSWHSALPWFPIANRAENAVALLVEMLADDQARQAVDDQTLASAIALVGTAQPETAGSAASDAFGTEGLTESGFGDAGFRAPARRRSPGDAPTDLVGPRVRRLLSAPAPLRPAAATVVVTAALGLLALPTALLTLPAVLLGIS